eukprot:gnl/MRDRNA2_/MRDRNA2_85020_c0_seq1.p1 gnl/MRDRNA2_/MRDRNA2_85020_c0~~gnl/MRDRNA2_/MRDRNA2_85020_c0_seq1.p1  ORF type:complete len:951 (-),score=256.80 gnl/MRDRNA2_/MRDRNA2_85020_c0_seq1:111-2963(-)
MTTSLMESGSYSQMKAYKPTDELVMQLQKRLASEAGEKEACRLALHKLKRTVDFYRQQFLSIAEQPTGAEGSLQRLRDVVRAMEAEIKDVATAGETSVADPAVPGSPSRNYDVLRQSLHETQKRCESLNGDMVRQAEANEELVSTLNTVKDANKRLLEQIRYQTDEITQLTQQRVIDEEKMENMSRKHRSEEEMWRQDTQRRVNFVRESADEKYNQMYRQLTDQLRRVRTRLELMKQDASKLRHEQQAQMMDWKLLVDAVQSQIQGAERDLVFQLDSYGKRHAQSKAQIDDVIYDLEVKLSSEKEMRQNEVSSWSHKYAVLTAEKEDIQARMTRDVSQLTSQLQAFERTLAVERKSWAEERSKLEQMCDDYCRQRNNCEQTLDHIKRDVIRLESQNAALDTENRTKEQSIMELRKQIRESDDALAAAVSGNEHLREQMEEQRNRFQEMNEADLTNCRNSYEAKLLQQKDSHSADLAMAQQQIRTMDEELQAKERELDKLNTQVATTQQECDALTKDLEIWKSQYEAANKARQTLEKEFTEARQAFAKEKLKLQEQNDTLATQNTALETENKTTNDQLIEFKRMAMARDTEMTSRINALEDMLKDTQSQLSEAKNHLLETTDTLAKTTSDAASQQQRALEIQSHLERDLESKKHESLEERRRLEGLCEVERKAAMESKEQYERWRDAHVASLKQVQDESAGRMQSMEKEKVRIEDKYRTDLAEAHKQLTSQQKRVDALEHDLSRVRYLLSESQANLNWVKSEKEREEREVSVGKQQMAEEVKQITTALEGALRNEVTLTQQLESTTSRYDQDRARMSKEVEDLKSSSAQQVADAEARATRLKQEYESQLSLSESRYTDSISKEKEKYDHLVRENDQLKRFIGEHRQASAGLSSLHTQLESHIQRLQHHTDELRGDLHRSGSSQAPLSPKRDLSSMSTLAATNPYASSPGRR